MVSAVDFLSCASDRHHRNPKTPTSAGPASSGDFGNRDPRVANDMPRRLAIRSTFTHLRPEIFREAATLLPKAGFDTWRSVGEMNTATQKPPREDRRKEARKAAQLSLADEISTHYEDDKTQSGEKEEGRMGRNSKRRPYPTAQNDGRSTYVIFARFLFQAERWSAFLPTK